MSTNADPNRLDTVQEDRHHARGGNHDHEHDEHHHHDHSHDHAYSEELRWTPKIGPQVKMDFRWSAGAEKADDESKTQTA